LTNGKFWASAGASMSFNVIANPSKCEETQVYFLVIFQLVYFIMLFLNYLIMNNEHEFFIYFLFLKFYDEHEIFEQKKVIMPKKF
jgi:hypothetical protein